MPYANPQDRKANERKRRRSPEGKAARKRQWQAAAARRRAEQPWTPDPRPLIEALLAWRAQ